MAVSVALNGAGCAGSVALLHYLVPDAFPTKAEKNMFFEVKTSVGETSPVRVLRLMVRVALFNATTDALFNAHPAFEPKFDQMTMTI